jgi:hypothetical protein
MKGITTDTIIMIVLAIAVLVGVGYWWWVNYGKVTGTFSQFQCQQAITDRCNEWKNAGYPTKMSVRPFCKSGQPKACGCVLTQDGFLAETELTVADNSWWDCLAPGCRQAYVIKISSQSDCP